MSIQSQINRILANIAAAYTAAQSKGATMPDTQDSEHLSDCILSIQSGGGDIPLGDKLYTFGAISDIHLRPDNYGQGIDDFNRTIPLLQNLGAEFVGISGDLGYYGNTNELELYKSALDTLATVPFHVVRGNHDKPFTDADWQTYTGFAPNHEFVYNGDVFLFVSLDHADDTTGTVDAGYTVGLAWLKERLARYKGARIFVFIHFPPTGYSGLADGQYYGWSSASTEDEAFVKAINQTKNVVVFTGHTHYRMNVQETYDNINIYRFNASNTALVHVPSNSRPRDASGTTVEQYSEGYIVEVYEQGLVIRGIDFVSGQPMLDYEYVLAMDNNPSASANAIILETNDVSINTGGSVQVGVKFDAPANAVINVSANNTNVTVSPATLTFTEGNYNVMQYITITGSTSADINASSVITLSADGFASKTISVTLNEIPLTDIVSGDNTIVDGAAYGGTHTGSVLKFPSAGSFNIKFVNLNLSNNSSAVLMKGNPIDGTINVYGTNTLHSASSRGMSSSSTTPINLVGVGNNATLAVQGDSSSSAGCKGDYNITNLDLSITTAKTPIDIISRGLAIVGNGSCNMNGSKVIVEACEGGTITAVLGTCVAGNTITITHTANDGYTYSGVKVNGVVNTGSITVPASGNTITIQGAFKAIPAYLTFSSPNSFTLAVNDATKHWDGTLEYSTNTSTWSVWDGTTTLSSAVSGSDNVLYLRGTGNTVIIGNKLAYQWILTGSNISCIGNIENLLDYATVKSGAHPTMADNCYRSMFWGCEGLIHAPDLPATTLSAYCYYQMFRDCHNLTQAPTLPATTLASNCYNGMFTGCTSITQAPTLPATELKNYCYTSMFNGCTALTQSPDLPATTLAINCCQSMFYNCQSLTHAPALPATTLASNCYHQMFYNCKSLTQAPALPATTLANNCYKSMFQGCTGITQAPTLPATTLKIDCYNGMFKSCTGLTSVSALPATALADNCYRDMFNGCTSLTQIPALPTTTLTNYCYYNMFWGCSKIKLSKTKTGEYTVAYRIPTAGTGTTASSALTSMFTATGGTFKGSPTIDTTYYLSNTNTVVSAA